LAVIGVTLKVMNRITHPHLSTGLYLLMGWLVVFAIKPLMASMPAAGLAWLVTGGLAYTGGWCSLPPMRAGAIGHFVWHLFVMAGTTCHFVAVYAYAA
jgi:hemolysin III